MRPLLTAIRLFASSQTMLKPMSLEVKRKDALSRHEDAIADYDQAIRLQPDLAEAYNSRGHTKNELGRYESAIADFDQAILLQPEHAKAHTNRGIAKAALSRTAEARSDFEAALALAQEGGDDSLKAEIERQYASTGRHAEQ